MDTGQVFLILGVTAIIAVVLSQFKNARFNIVRVEDIELIEWAVGSGCQQPSLLEAQLHLLAQQRSVVPYGMWPAATESASESDRLTQA